ncbi:MAG: hypothetical protein WAO98_01075 [Alphaproteobacteria bacterium]
MPRGIRRPRAYRDLDTNYYDTARPGALSQMGEALPYPHNRAHMQDEPTRRSIIFHTSGLVND